MAHGLFITGTDTGIGKTIVSTLLIQHYVAQGERVIGMKPIASGAQLVNGQLCNDDALALMQASNVATTYAQINPYCFAPAIAPHLAAAQVRTHISLTQIAASYATLSVQAERIIVEGVGGWRVPIDDEYDVSDIAIQLKLPVILVVGMRLGCINHALLTVESIAAKGANFIGWIANHIDANMSQFDENIQTLKTKIDAPLLGVIPHIQPGKILCPTQVNLAL